MFNVKISLLLCIFLLISTHICSAVITLYYFDHVPPLQYQCVLCFPMEVVYFCFASSCFCIFCSVKSEDIAGG